MPRPLWFQITLIDCNGQNLAMWTYDEQFPVTPPMFTYPNEDKTCPYRIRFMHLYTQEMNLPCGDINIEIYRATKEFRGKIKEKT